jgi:hypothetical protein
MKTYTVESIIGKRYIQKIEYLVKWKGYKIEESTWEPIENLITATDIIEEYE